MKRVSPRQHLRIDKRLRANDAKPGDVYMMIDQLRRIDIVESTLDQIRGFHAETGIQIFRLFRERAADGMDQTHLIYSNRSSCRASSPPDLAALDQSQIHQRERQSAFCQT